MLGSSELGPILYKNKQFRSVKKKSKHSFKKKSCLHILFTTNFPVHLYFQPGWVLLGEGMPLLCKGHVATGLFDPLWAGEQLRCVVPTLRY